MSSNQKGQTLLELVIVVAVSVIIVGALVFTTISSLRNASFSKNQAQATKLAQEGIELVRAGRDRNTNITGNLSINSIVITSWNGNGAACSANNPDSIWCNKLKGSCGSDIPPVTYCYFNVNSAGELAHLTAAPSIPSLAEEKDSFKRVIIISDDDVNFSNRKTVTAIVTWNDFSGPHESRLTTILRRL